MIGTTVQGESRAYARDDLLLNEVVDDLIGGSPVVVNYCPLASLAAVYTRELDAAVLSLAASGWAYDGRCVLCDFETESLWFHLAGRSELTCIGGQHAGESLAEIGWFFGRWDDWKTANPLSKFYVATPP